MKEIKQKWGSDIVDAYHQVLLSEEPCYTEFNGVYITNVKPNEKENRTEIPNHAE